MDSYDNDINNNIFTHLFGINMAEIISEINGKNSQSKNNNNRTNFKQLLIKDIDNKYKSDLNSIKNQIDKALELGNKDLFIKLSKKYSMMLAEL